MRVVESRRARWTSPASFPSFLRRSTPTVRPTRRRCAASFATRVASGVDGATYPGVASEVSELVARRARCASSPRCRTSSRADGRSSSASASSQRRCASRSDASALERDVAAFMVAAPADRKDVGGSRSRSSSSSRARVSRADHAAERPAAGRRGSRPRRRCSPILQRCRRSRTSKKRRCRAGSASRAARARSPRRCSASSAVPADAMSPTSCAAAPRDRCPRSSSPKCTQQLMAAHRAGDHDRVRRLFTRMLPMLNVQAVFRWALTKYVLQRARPDRHRAPARGRTGARRLDRADVDAFLDDIGDLLLPAETASVSDRLRATTAPEARSSSCASRAYTRRHLVVPLPGSAVSRTAGVEIARGATSCARATARSIRPSTCR